MKIDAHQHFWHYNADEYQWIDPEMEALKQDFLPEDLEPLLAQAGLDGSIAVQARETLAETEWLLELAERYTFIRGVVGWVDLRATNVDDQLESLSRFPKLKGVRHVVKDEPDDRFMLRPDFLRGLGSLHRFDLTYDLLLFPRHLPIALEVVRQFPEQRFIVDHLAGPPIDAQLLDPWEEQIRALATCANVTCKVSGMVTDARWKQWAYDDFRPYLDVIFDCFGVDRLLFGTDWPVCTLSGRYQEVCGIVETYVRQFAPDAHAKVFGENAAAFYKL